MTDDVARTVPDRQPLDPAAVTQLTAGTDAAVGVPRWQVEVVAETGSTNADLLARSATAETGVVRVAELQTGGRGRLERSWTSPPGAGLTFSLLVRPDADVRTWGWLPLLTGLALVRTVGPSARLKWPNDLLLGPGAEKAAGILVQTSGSAVVIGVGLNVSTTAAELPVPTATSLVLHGVRQLDRSELLGGFLAEFGALYAAWLAESGDADRSGLAQAYRQACATLDSEVSVQLSGSILRGLAQDIDSTGRLLVRPLGQPAAIALAAGDVTHLRDAAR